MDFEKLLCQTSCSCGLSHSCDIRYVQIGRHALKRIPSLTADYRHILLVADTNTYALCGPQVESLLGEKREHTQIYQRNGLLVPNEEAIDELSRQVTERTDLIVGIGSGVIQDLCKYVSFCKKRPYHIIATAPSMDGYASKGAAMIIGNMKITYNAHVPEAIIGDLDILKTAPLEMIQSGYGDILGKYSCLNDWKLSRIVNGESFCQEVYDLTYDMLLKTRDLGPALLQREPEAIGILMEALVGVGIAMAYVGNSRPASGSEHHLSHFFEVTGLLNRQPYFMHGTDVAFSAVYTQKLREELLEMDVPTANGGHDDVLWEQRIRSIYTRAAQGVIDLQHKLGWYQQDRMGSYRAHWEEIRSVLKEVPSSETLKGYLASIGLNIADFEAMYGREKIENALWYAKDLKDRYTVLWMYYDLKR